jgi:hypothetical protein
LRARALAPPDIVVSAPIRPNAHKDVANLQPTPATPGSLGDWTLAVLAND